CMKKDGQPTQALGEAFVQDQPQDTKSKVSFLPDLIRWIPFGRADSCVLKLDENYQTVLFGEHKRKYMWILSRNPQLDKNVVNEYLQYAQSVGYDLSDVIHTKQTQR